MSRRQNAFRLRRHWSAVLVIVIVTLRASPWTSAHIATAPDALIHRSAETELVVADANAENARSSSSCVDGGGEATRSVLEAKLLASSSRVRELVDRVEDLTATSTRFESEGAAYRREVEDLVAADASRSKSFEEEMERTERDHSRILNETYAEIRLLEEAAERRERDLESEAVERAACRQELNEFAAADANYSKSLEERIGRMERDYSRVLNETFAEIRILEETTERQKRNLKTKEERYQNQRKKFLAVDRELRDMHASATSRYVNVTLMCEDAWNGLERRFARASRRVENRFLRKLRPKLKEAKMRFRRMQREANAYLRPRIVSWKRNAHQRWLRSTTIRPALERAWRKVVDHPTLVEIRVSCRLSAVSAVEELSKGALAYLKNEDGRKRDAEERERKKRDDPARRQLERLHRRRGRGAPEAAPRGRKSRSDWPSFVWARARPVLLSSFEYASKNSERLYKKCVALFPLAFALGATGSRIIGGLFLYWGIPTPLIWAFVVLRFVIGLRRHKRSPSE